MLRTMKGKGGVVRTPRSKASPEGYVELSEHVLAQNGRHPDEDVEIRLATGIDNTRRIGAALDQLKTQERELVLDHYALGKSQQELAAEHNRPKITIFRDLDRVRKSWAQVPVVVPEAVAAPAGRQLELHAQQTGPTG